MNISIIKAAGLLIICLGLGVAVPVEAQNLLLDPGFELKDGSWTCYNGAELCNKLPNQEPPTVHEGFSSLGLRAQGGVAYVGAYQALEATPRMQYTLGGWALNSIHSQLSNGCYGLAKIIFFGLGWSEEHVTGHLVDPTGPWAPFLLSAEAPEGTTQVRFEVMLKQSSRSGGNALL